MTGAWPSSLCCTMGGACAGGQNKSLLDQGRAIDVGTGTLVKFPDGAAGLLLQPDMKPTAPAAVSEILQANKAEHTYKEMINELKSAPKDADDANLKKIVYKYKQSFKKANIDTFLCKVSQGKEEKSQVIKYLVFADTVKAKNYTPENVEEESSSGCTAM